MEMFVFMAGILICLLTAIVLAVYVAIQVPKYNYVVFLVVLIVSFAVLGILYNNFVQEYFIGKRITTEQICTDVQKLELYWR